MNTVDGLLPSKFEENDRYGLGSLAWVEPISLFEINERRLKKKKGEELDEKVYLFTRKKTGD